MFILLRLRVESGDSRGVCLSAARAGIRAGLSVLLNRTFLLPGVRGAGDGGGRSGGASGRVPSRRDLTPPPRRSAPLRFTGEDTEAWRAKSIQWPHC